MASHFNTDLLESALKLCQLHKLIIVLVQSSQKPDHVLLKRLTSFCAGLDLPNDVCKAGFRKDIRVILHVLLGVVVAGDEHKFETGKLHSATNAKISFLVVLARDWVVLAFTLHKTAAYPSRILVTDLVDLNRVIATIERNDEVT